MILENNIFLAFVFTTFAGLSTLLGAIFVFFLRGRQKKFLPIGLGFSAGIMLYLSFFDLLKEAQVELLNSGVQNVSTAVAMFFMIGFVVSGIIDIFTHRYTNVCAHRGCPRIGKNMHGRNRKYRKHSDYNDMLFRTGIFTMLALTLHNFPEGIATFGATTVNTAFGLSIAIAIAIHNIPEGFCIALPIFHATGSYKKSFFYTALAGIAEPIGALVAFLFLYPFMTEYIMGGILAAVAGIMVYVAIDSLLPTARRLGHWHTALGSMLFGMLIMFLFSNFLL